MHRPGDREDFLLCAFSTGNALEDGKGLLRLADPDQKTWRLRSKRNENEKYHRWHDAGEKHPSPVIHAGIPKQIVDSVGNQDADDNRQLVEGPHAPADRRGGNFRNVHG